MPSPIGHALGAFAAGWTIAPDEVASPDGSPRSARDRFRSIVRSRRVWIFVAVGVAADLDLLVGLHSRRTHSVGAALLTFAVALWLTRRRGREGLWLSLAVAAAYATHPLLDYLAEDTTPPLGIMALWPFSDRFFLSPVSVFLGISRKYWLAATWARDAVSVARELVILGPLAVAVGWFRGGAPPSQGT